VDRDDIRVAERRGCFRLDIEPLDVPLVGELPGQDHLDRHNPVQLPLPGLIDDPHSPLGDRRQQFVVAKRLPGSLLGSAGHRGLLKVARPLVARVQRGIRWSSLRGNPRASRRWGQRHRIWRGRRQGGAARRRCQGHIVGLPAFCIFLGARNQRSIIGPCYGDRFLFHDTALTPGSEATARNDPGHTSPKRKRGYSISTSPL
jgi:hypothetical protein